MIKWFLHVVGLWLIWITGGWKDIAGRPLNKNNTKENNSGDKNGQKCK